MYEKVKLKLVNSFRETGNLNFWLANGVNYLVSDYTRGEWNPIFPDIYGEDRREYTRGEIVLKINELADAGTLNCSLEIVLGWVLMTDEDIFETVLLMSEQVGGEGIKARSPHHDAVWKIYHQIQTAIQDSKSPASPDSMPESP